MEAAAAEADAERRTLMELETASGHLKAGDGLLATIGLLGNDPQSQLAAARSRFEDGDLAAADRQAGALVASVQGGADTGRLRVAAAGGGLLLLDGVWLWFVRPGRRRRRAASLPA
jgi:hypothetical protein